VDVRRYRHVLALADHASFPKASKSLGISRPALTKGPFRIERELGQRPFDGHGPATSPTVFGAIVVDTARGACANKLGRTRTPSGHSDGPI
jgi:DNA-binding transcriptional LysR family regulator